MSVSLNGLNPYVKAKAEQFLINANKRLTGPYEVRIVQAYRSKEEQQALYEQGRTRKVDSKGNKLSIVTNAPGGKSMHNFGLAFDIALFTKDGKKASWDTKADYDKDGKSDWMECVEEAKKLGFIWGGDWDNDGKSSDESFIDNPHFQMTAGLSDREVYSGKVPVFPSASPVKKAAVKDVSSKNNTPAIKAVGEIKIVGVKQAAFICDKPSPNSKNLATIDLGKTIKIAGSVPGWWEVIFSGKRAYINSKYGKKI